MVKVSKKSHHTKYGKQELRNKKTENNAVSHHTKVQKDKRKILTNARLSIPHFQNGIFTKAKSSQICHRKEDAQLNLLNKARMNEKLSEIINLAKNLEKSKEKKTYDDTDTQDKLSSPNRNFNHENEAPSWSSPSMITYEKIKHHNFPKSLHENNKTCKNEIENTKNIFDDKNLTSGANGENISDNKHKEFKLFLTFFDNAASLQNVFTEDFIASEKLDLKRKKRISEEDIVTKQSSNCKTEEFHFHSQNSNGKVKKEESGIIKDKKGFHRISKPKCNPNYNAFKTSKQVPVVNTTNQQMKNHQALKNNNNFSEYLLPDESNKRNIFYDKMFTLRDENVFQSDKKYEQKSILLNPISFLTHSLPENVSNKHKKDTSPFKLFSQPCTSDYKEERKIIRKFEIPEHHKHLSTQHNFLEKHLKHPSQSPIPETNIFDLMFEKGDGEFDHFNENQHTNKFSDDDFSLVDINTSENYLNSSQCRRSNDIFSFLEETNTNDIVNSTYSQIDIKIPSLENQSKYCVLENTSNVSQYSFQTTDTYHKSKIDISPVSDNQDVDVRETNFWFRRKMF